MLGGGCNVSYISGMKAYRNNVSEFESIPVSTCLQVLKKGSSTKNSKMLSNSLEEWLSIDEVKIPFKR